MQLVQQRCRTAGVRTLEAVLRRLAHGNDLGDQPLTFMVASGIYTAQLAAQCGLCKPEQCDIFAQLNLYQHYGLFWRQQLSCRSALYVIQALHSDGWREQGRFAVKYWAYLEAAMTGLLRTAASR